MSESAVMKKIDGEIRMTKDFTYMCRVIPNGVYRVVIEKMREKRTIKQNDLMWMWLKCIEDETGQMKNDIYCHYCKKFLSRVIIVDGEEEMVYDTSSKLNTKQMSEFMTNIQADAAIEFGISLPSPQDPWFDDFINEYK